MKEIFERSDPAALYFRYIKMCWQTVGAIFPLFFRLVVKKDRNIETTY